MKSLRSNICKLQAPQIRLIRTEILLNSNLTPEIDDEYNVVVQLREFGNSRNVLVKVYIKI